MSTRTSEGKKRRGPGRPATGHDPHVSFRLPAELVDVVDGLAKTEKVSRSDVLRSAFIAGLLATPRENREQIEAIAAALAQGDIAAVIKAIALDPVVFRGLEQAVEHFLGNADKTALRGLEQTGEQVEKLPVRKEKPAKNRKA